MTDACLLYKRKYSGKIGHVFDLLIKEGILRSSFFDRVMRTCTEMSPTDNDKTMNDGNAQEGQNNKNTDKKDKVRNRRYARNQRNAQPSNSSSSSAFKSGSTHRDGTLRSRERSEGRSEAPSYP